MCNREPLCRYGQGTSETATPSNDYSTAYAALLAEGVEDEWADSLVCMYGAQSILEGLRHVTYNNDGRRVARFARKAWDGGETFVPYILPMKRCEPWPDPSPVPQVRSTATELTVVAAGVVAIMLACWLWSPLVGAGAAALAVVFAVACWVGGDK